MITKLSLLSSLIGLSYAHYTFPWINVNGVNSTYWQYTRMTNNDYSLGPVTNVNSSDFRCYDSAPPITPPTPTSLSVAAGTYINIGSEPGGVCCGMYHQSVVNVYMAAVPSGQNAATYEPTGAVWFKVAEVPPITDGGTSITWVAMNQQYVSFQIPSQLPSGNYLVRVENIGLHVASTYGGAQFYISCSLLTVTGGGSGTPGPLVAIPGVYTGYEPGILIDIYYPIPSSYPMPGPALWPGTNTGSAGSGVGSGTGTGSTTKSSSSSSSSSTKSTTTTTTTKTTTKTTTTSSASGATQTAYGQCGGTGYTGATTCVSGYTCKQQSVYYSQCLPS